MHFSESTEVGTEGFRMPFRINKSKEKETNEKCHLCSKHKWQVEIV